MRKAPQSFGFVELFVLLNGLLYRLMKYISQLAAMVPPTNMTKQKAPKRIIILGWARCVIPKTTEAKSEKSRTALK
jgi:hypothetical protein